MKSKNSGSKTKKPPFIQFFLDCLFSLNSTTLFDFIITSPNLAGGLTAVTVAIF